MEVQYPIIQLKNVYKSFQVGEQIIPVLKNISLDINLTDFLIIFGPSGSGKSVLLHTIMGLERSTEGQVLFFGTDFTNNLVSEDQIAGYRMEHVGMVYQQSNWIKSLNVIENVAFPLLLAGHTREFGLHEAKALLKDVGMFDWATYSPMELSSGQQQMIALARALVTDPEIVIADEPTGNLDYKSGQRLMEFLRELNKEANKTIVMVTHDLDYLRFASKTVRMLNGEIQEIKTEKELENYITLFRNKHGNFKK